MPRVLLCFFTAVCAATAVAADWSRDFPLERRSRYFDVRYQRSGWDAAAFVRFADAFVDIVDRDFVRVSLEHPIGVLVLPDQASFQAYLRTRLGIARPPAYGMYLPKLGLFATYEDSGLGTFTHQIMYPIVFHGLSDSPQWAGDAVPAFFEKFFGYWEGDRLVVEWGYQNPWRLDRIGGALATLDLSRILAGEARLGQSERRLVTVFLWQQCRLERFLRLIAARDLAGRQTYLEAAMERPFEEIVPVWKAYLADLAAHRADAMRVPPSAVYKDRAAFEGALAEQRPWLQSRACDEGASARRRVACLDLPAHAAQPTSSPREPATSAARAASTMWEFGE
jgi:hypothetical protein